MLPFYWKNVVVVGILIFLKMNMVFASLPSAGDGFVLDYQFTSQVFENTKSQIDKAVKIGARHFNLPLLLCQDRIDSNDMHWCAQDVNLYQSQIEQVAYELKSQGLTFAFFPFLASSDHQWRGSFQPKDFNLWSQAYLGYLKQIADMASYLGASEFMVGSELGQLYSHESFWRQTLEDFRKRLSIPVFIVANWDQVDKISFWDASDYIGVSAYFPLANYRWSSTTVEALVKSWEKWKNTLLDISSRHKRYLYFSEVGYMSTKTAAVKPWSFSSNALDLDLQARLFTAFGILWGQSHELARFQIWALTPPINPKHDTGFGVIGKPAQQSVEKIFSLRNALRCTK